MPDARLSLFYMDQIERRAQWADNGPCWPIQLSSSGTKTEDFLFRIQSGGCTDTRPFIYSIGKGSSNGYSKTVGEPTEIKLQILSAHTFAPPSPATDCTDERLTNHIPSIVSSDEKLNPTGQGVLVGVQPNFMSSMRGSPKSLPPPAK